MSPSPSHRHTTWRVAACAALGTLGAMITVGCLLALFLASLSFFGDRPQAPLGYTLVLWAGAAAGVGAPALVTARALPTWRQRLIAAAVVPAVLLLGLLFVVSMLAA